MSSLKLLSYARQEHGGCYVTELPSGRLIPWKPLPIGEFMEYEQLFRSGTYAPPFVEDLIFQRCVVDTVVTRNLGQEKAGVISAVVQAILAHSGPQGPEDLNLMLNISRQKIEEPIHSLVEMICLAFPAYKPEDLYLLDYETLMLRVAQAERKLMQSGMLIEPVAFYSTETTSPGQQEQVVEQEKKEQQQSLLERFYEQEGIHVPDEVKKRSRERLSQPRPPSKPTVPGPPPIPDVGPEEQTIITKADMAEYDAFLSGWDQDVVNKIKWTKDTAGYYSDYLEQLGKDGKLKIKSPEERKKEAEVRMAQNKKKVIEQQQKIREAQKAELPKLLKIREEARKRKERKNKARRKQ